MPTQQVVVTDHGFADLAGRAGGPRGRRDSRGDARRAGGLVGDGALAAALDSGELAGAVLDGDRPADVVVVRRSEAGRRSVGGFRA